MIDTESGEEVKSGEEYEHWLDEYEAAISGDAHKWVQEYTAQEVSDFSCLFLALLRLA